jgi:hypothetical protein
MITVIGTPSSHMMSAGMAISYVGVERGGMDWDVRRAGS